MEKTSVVKQAKYLQKTWANDYGTFHVHGIAFDNGDFGEYSSIDSMQDKFEVGALATYTLTGEPGKHKIKPVNPSFEPSNTTGPAKAKETPSDKNRSFALAYAKDFVCAQITKGNDKLGPADVLMIAEDFNNWLNNETKTEAIPPQSWEPEAEAEIDDLPF